MDALPRTKPRQEMSQQPLVFLKQLVTMLRKYWLEYGPELARRHGARTGKGHVHVLRPVEWSIVRWMKSDEAVRWMFCYGEEFKRYDHVCLVIGGRTFN